MTRPIGNGDVPDKSETQGLRILGEQWDGRDTFTIEEAGVRSSAFQGARLVPQRSRASSQPFASAGGYSCRATPSSGSWPARAESPAMTTPITSNKTALASVILRDGKTAGFVLRRGPKGVEAYDADEWSIGLFRTEDEAVAAIFEKAEASR